MGSYLVEFRLSGSARKYVEDIVFDVARKFDVKGATRNRVPPHVTIIGPFETANEQKLVHETIETCKKYNLMTIKFSGFTSFGNWLLGNRVLAINIEQSSELELLRVELVAKLSGFCQLSKFDTRKWKPHATIAFKDIDKKFGQIKAYLENRSCPEIQHYVLRVTLLKNTRIVCEYDFLQHRKLTRLEALNRETKKTTILLLKKRLAKGNLGGMKSSARHRRLKFLEKRGEELESFLPSVPWSFSPFSSSFSNWLMIREHYKPCFKLENISENTI